MPDEENGTESGELIPKGPVEDHAEARVAVNSCMETKKWRVESFDFLVSSFFKRRSGLETCPAHAVVKMEHMPGYAGTQ